MSEASPPTSAEELRAAILERYDGLSKRLQQIARYVLDEPNELALETLAVIAERSGVQPSAIVRFAKSFGFDGASQMQRLFRDGLLSGHAALGYSERRAQLHAAPSTAAGPPAAPNCSPNSWRATPWRCRTCRRTCERRRP
jgi:DNA-binding MurR/RpiR family transcriptional regulator